LFELIAITKVPEIQALAVAAVVFLEWLEWWVFFDRKEGLI